MTLVEAIRAGSIATVERLLQEGTDIHQLDADGWTPLNWAAAAGDIAMMTLLLKSGASASFTGKDQRTPAMIALAAGKSDSARFLQEVVSKYSSEVPERQYCMAVRLKEVREFPAWTEANSKGSSEADLAETTIIYLHANYVVTCSVWLDSEVLLDKVTPEWKQFCQSKLTFDVPDDVDLLTA
jgi:ankyrin repeat protein